MTTTAVAVPPVSIDLSAKDRHAILENVLAALRKRFYAPEKLNADWDAAVAHARLMEILGEIGITPEISCLAATPADIQWMIQSGSGLALIDQKTPLDPSLTTRPIANVNWTVDTAFVHPVCAEHPALPMLVRHFRKANGSKPHETQTSQKRCK